MREYYAVRFCDLPDEGGDAVRQTLFALIGIALLQTVLCLLVEEEKYRSILCISGGLAMILLLLGQVLSFDYNVYASALREQIHTSELTENIRTDNERLNRMFIEQECRAYILDKAYVLEVPMIDAAVSLRWNTDGYWYPCSAELTIPSDGEKNDTLSDAIQTDLGIPLSEQTWIREGNDES